MAGEVRALDISTPYFGTEVLVIADTRAVGADAPCRKVLVLPESGKTVYIGNAVTVDDDPLLLTAVYTEIEVTNTNLLHFFGTNGDKVYLIYMN